MRKAVFHPFVVDSSSKAILTYGPSPAWPNYGDNTCPPGFGNDNSKTIWPQVFSTLPLLSRRVTRCRTESSLCLPSQLLRNARLGSSDPMPRKTPNRLHDSFI